MAKSDQTIEQEIIDQDEPQAPVVTDETATVEMPSCFDLIEAWFQKNFHNTPIDVDTYNRLYTAKEELKSMFKEDANV